jgi:DNA-binding MarR family transcriptional regulator
MYNIPMTSPETRLAAECLAGRIRLLNRVVTGLYDEALRPHGVRVSQMNILVMIAASGPTRATEVCRRLRLDKSTLSRDLARLVGRGWVRVTPDSGRAQLLEATDAGRALIRAVVPAWEAAQKRVGELLGEAFAEGVHAAVRNLQANGSDGE